MANILEDHCDMCDKYLYDASKDNFNHSLFYCLCDTNDKQILSSCRRLYNCLIPEFDKYKNLLALLKIKHADRGYKNYHICKECLEKIEKKRSKQ